MKLKDKIAIVTGGAQGIGEAICEAYAKEGATVIIADKNLISAEKVANKIQQTGAKAKAFLCDVSDRDSVKNLVKEVIKEFGDVDILVNCAGIYIGKLIEEYSEQDWDLTVDINLKGTFLMSQAVVPIMKKKSSGKIICIASIYGSVGATSSSPYCASKAGVLGLVKSFAAELAQHKINVNAISPGFAATPMNETFRKDSAIVNFIKERTPTGIPYMNPNELTGAAIFLASDDSRAVHGIDLLVDNGWCAV